MSYTTRVTSLDHVPTQGSSRVVTNKCCINVSKYQLHFLNFFDFMLGSSILAFAITLSQKIGGSSFTDAHVAWVCWFSIIIGILLILSVILSSCAVTGGENLRCCVSPSKYISIFVGVLAVAMAIGSLADKSEVYHQLDSNGEKYGLSGEEIDLIKEWYVFIAPLCAGIFVLSIIRYRASSHFKKNVSKLDGEFQALLDEDDKAWSDKLEYKKASREDKYKNLRSHYAEKYNAPQLEETKSKV